MVRSRSTETVVEDSRSNSKLLLAQLLARSVKPDKAIVEPKTNIEPKPTMADENKIEKAEEPKIEEEITGYSCYTSRNKIYPQIQAVLIANLTLLACGIAYAWPAPTLPKLEEESSDLHLTNDQETWVVSALALGSILGPSLSALLLDHIGRKWFLYFTAVPFIICWVLTYIANSWIELLIGRLVCGLSVGALFAMVPVYLGEIVETKIRGAAGTLMNVFLKFGYLIVYSVGPLVDRQMLALICLIPTVIFLLSFFWIPESPYYYLKKGKAKQAELALIWLRSSKETKQELKEMNEYIEIERNASFKDLYAHKNNRKALLTLVVLLTGQQFTGFMGIQSFAGVLFKHVGADFSSNIVLIIIGAVPLATSVVFTFIIDKLRRRHVYLTSIFGITLCLLLIGTYFLLETMNIDLHRFSWVPLVLMLIYFIVNFGIEAIPSVIASEVFPMGVKSYATMIANTYGAILAVAVSVLYPVVQKKFGYHVVFYMFAAIELVIGIVVAIWMPETSGKSFVEIQEILGGTTEKSPKKAQEDTILSP
ncbi:facilitated trehalose transporter Tret1 [Calliopsis andreniformis]|uniref:facilitated trehalose transporter Tret1 n=1 Tax=Calliopsis andreniformis TaxID=337506 RepID=UPI003FCDE0CD